MPDTPSMPDAADFARRLRRQWAIVSLLALLVLASYCAYSWRQERAELAQALAAQAQWGATLRPAGPLRTGRPVVAGHRLDDAAQAPAARVWQNWWRHSSALLLLAGLQFVAGLALVRLLLRRERQHLKQLAGIALVDELTGLPSRVAATQQLQRKLRQAQEYNGSFAVLFLDLDAFQLINGQFGHDQGDLVLREASRRLAACIREQDHLARLGGDEFMAIIACSSRSQVQTAAARLLQAVAKPFQVNGVILPVSLSIGISLYPEDGRTATALMQQADLALHAVKGGRRNTWLFYTPELAQSLLADVAQARRAAVTPDSELA